MPFTEQEIEDRNQHVKDVQDRQKKTNQLNYELHEKQERRAKLERKAQCFIKETYVYCNWTNQNKKLIKLMCDFHEQQ